MIIDTNVYGALQRGEPGLTYSTQHSDQVVLPLPVVAELKAGFAKGTLTERNMRLFEDFLSRPEVGVLFPGNETANVYARLQAFCWNAA